MRNRVGVAVVLQILRRVADDAAGVKPVVRADRRQPGEVNVRPDDALRPDFHAFVDDGVGSDLDGGIQLRFRVNDGGWMNHVLAWLHR